MDWPGGQSTSQPVHPVPPSFPLPTSWLACSGAGEQACRHVCGALRRAMMLTIACSRTG